MGLAHLQFDVFGWVDLKKIGCFWGFRWGLLQETATGQALTHFMTVGA